MSKEQKQRARERENRRQLVGENLSFEASEAYKLLRTNLTLSLPAGEGACRLIGITSSVLGEGKSTTAINLAYSLGKGRKKVLLLEADLRKPVLRDAFKLPRGRGLSNLLTGGCDFKEAITMNVFHPSVGVLPAGDIPPNPAELLNSTPMKTVLDTVSQIFDYIIVDLPPVTIVSDALAMANKLDGMIVVVRKDYCDQRALAETMRRLEQVKAKVLGFVMTHADDTEKKYKKYGYGYGYGKS
ncbi:MAG TPA: CpsD/CapB family tyrosine-protein kinase [Candidatus Hydrogenedentes bacterium]|nr:CpsD/CapB family tyrosine-protein kinase [Candidatus Hydrogenedentota bacterium]